MFSVNKLSPLVIWQSLIDDQMVYAKKLFPARFIQILLVRSGLKGQCYEDFAALGHFWARIIILRL